MEISGKVVAITGASSGIGQATARYLAAQGAKVVLGARREERIKALAEEITAAGGQARYQRLDVASLDDMQAFIDFAVQGFGRLDVVINNAGVMPLSPLESLKIDEWNRMIDVNIRGVLHGIAAALPVMKAQGKGHFINVASIGAHQVYKTAAVYCATKYAVWAISDGLRQENKDIRVTILTPGVVESELADTISHTATKEFMDEFRKVALKPEAIARAIAYAIGQPEDVDVSEIVVRPVASEY